MHLPTYRIAQTTFVTPVVEHCLKQEIAQWVHHGGWINNTSHHEPKFYHGATPLKYMI